jgi:uncharacterized protein YoxC
MLCCTILNTFTTSCSPIIGCFRIVQTTVTIKTASKKALRNLKQHNDTLKDQRLEIQLLEQILFNFRTHLPEQGILEQVCEHSSSLLTEANQLLDALENPDVARSVTGIWRSSKRLVSRITAENFQQLVEITQEVRRQMVLLFILRSSMASGKKGKDVRLLALERARWLASVLDVLPAGRGCKRRAINLES